MARIQDKKAEYCWKAASDFRTALRTSLRPALDKSNITLPDQLRIASIYQITMPDTFNLELFDIGDITDILR
jgi:hypothetical protein